MALSWSCAVCSQACSLPVLGMSSTCDVTSGDDVTVQAKLPKRRRMESCTEQVSRCAAKKGKTQEQEHVANGGRPKSEGDLQKNCQTGSPAATGASPCINCHRPRPLLVPTLLQLPIWGHRRPILRPIFLPTRYCARALPAMHPSASPIFGRTRPELKPGPKMAEGHGRTQAQNGRPQPKLGRTRPQSGDDQAGCRRTHPAD